MHPSLDDSFDQRHKYSYILAWNLRHVSRAGYRGDIPREAVSRCIHTFYFFNVHTRSISTDDDKHIYSVNRHTDIFTDVNIYTFEYKRSFRDHNKKKKVNWSRDMDNECVTDPSIEKILHVSSRSCSVQPMIY